MQLSIRLAMPSPSPAEKKEVAPMTIEDKVRRAIELVDSGYCSDVEWLMLNKLYKALKERKPSRRISNLIDMIEPVLAKFGYHGTSTED